MSKTLKDLIFITIFIIVTTILVWLPHYLAMPNFLGLNFQGGFSTIYSNFDGLEYVVIAKTFYQPDLVVSLPAPQPAVYYASHFPGYSIAILLFAPILGFLKSMLFVSVLFTIASVITFYFLVKDFKLSGNPLLLSIIFTLLPARWLVVRSVGSAEPMFMFFTILSIYLFMKYESLQKYRYVVFSAIAALFALITRSPGMLLLISLVIYIHFKMYTDSKRIGFLKAWINHLRFFPFIIVPLGLLGIFYLYSLNMGDFWAYFHSGDNIHLTLPPFQSLNKNQPWVGEIWLEDIVYIYLLGLLAGLLLLKQKLYPMAFFVLTYLAAAFFVAHRDISRYTLPIVPFVIIAFEKILTSREFKIVLVILSLAIYLYAQNFIIYNTASIATFAPY
ncbi:MAG: hypothetical protein Q7R49_04760 [Candidatus Daviesbacteria bacterium]|nr:hypothetical protein [Candidatus Daviesbacteria bacterium]